LKKSKSYFFFSTFKESNLKKFKISVLLLGVENTTEALIYQGF